MAVGWFIAGFLVAIIIGFIILLILGIIAYTAISSFRADALQAIVDNINKSAIAYCTSSPPLPTVPLPSLPTSVDLYDQTFAVECVKLCNFVSLGNCANITPVAPPGYNNATILKSVYNGVNVTVGGMFMNGSVGVIAFGGSLIPEQWRIDLDSVQVKAAAFTATPAINVHRGFYNYYVAVRPAIQSWLASNSATITQLLITGHSLGGATATLCYLDIMSGNLLPTPTTVLPTTVLYSFASPRVGDNSFLNAFNPYIDNSFRVNNTEDLIPQLPLVNMGTTANPVNYVHIGKGIAFTYSYGNYGDNHNKAYWFQLPANEDVPTFGET